MPRQITPGLGSDWADPALTDHSEPGLSPLISSRVLPWMNFRPPGYHLDVAVRMRWHPRMRGLGPVALEVKQLFSPLVIHFSNQAILVIAIHRNHLVAVRHLRVCAP